MVIYQFINHGNNSTGAPGQFAHIATTYAAVMSICILKDKEAYKIIDRLPSEILLVIYGMKIK